MENQFFTHEQALSICEKYQFLVGQAIESDSNEILQVACVAVSPFDAINKWIFFNFYLDHLDPKKAIAFYTPPFFDVVVILHSAGNPAYTYKDLKTYLTEHNMELIMHE